jgi:predicted negative regulator of RcsB-dependent stress response
VKVEGDLQRVVDQRVARLLVATGKSDEAIKLLGSADRQQQPGNPWRCADGAGQAR